MHKFKLARQTVVVLLALTCSAAALVRGEEPYRQFLEQLRNQQLHDLALVYLDGLNIPIGSTPEGAADLQIERAVLLQESASAMSARNTQRTSRLDDAEKAFQEFLNTHKSHPRRSEARLGLGNLLLARGEEASAEGDPKQARPAAIKFFGEAQTLFESAKKELAAALDEMKGAKIDANDEAKRAQRTSFRDDYRRAELLAAFATERMGRSQADGSPEWKAELAKAEKMYTELYNHEKERVEARNYALFYRSVIQRDFGKFDDAIDGFNRIISIEGIDELRPLQFKALTELSKLWSSKEQAKYALAVELAVTWEKMIRPDEKTNQDVLEFLLVSAQAKMDLASALQAKDPDDRSIARLRREARDSVQKLARINGPHQSSARQLMGQLGVSKEKSDEPLNLPVVKNFAEAFKEIEVRFEQLETNETPEQQTLLQALDASTDEDKKKELSEQLAKVNGRVDRLREQISELTRSAVRMFPAGNKLAELTDVRHRMAFNEYQRGNHWEAVAVGEFLADTHAGSEAGLSYATLTLASLGKLLNEANLEQQKSLSSILLPLSEFMGKSWPNANETQLAWTTLVRLAMNAGDFRTARAYLEKLPTGSGKSDSLRREIGLVMAGQYFQESVKLAEGVSPSPELLEKRDSALEQLTLATKGIKKEELDSRWIEAINNLIHLQLATGKSQEAFGWIENPDLSPVAALRSNPDLIESRSVKLETFRVALQATAGQLGAGGGGAEVLKQIEKLLEELQAAAGKDAEGQQLLSNNLILVARDFQELATAADTPDKRQKMANGLALVCRQIANGTEDFNKKMWAGATLAKIGKTLEDPAKPGAGALQKEAVAILESILEKESRTPGWITMADGEIAVRLQLVRALRQSGRFQEGLDQVAKLLEKNASRLDVQVEAADLYQTWGERGSSDKYRLAAVGANAVWGWGKLAKALERKPQHAAQFFDCRYRLSLCYYRYALGQSDPATKKKELEKAERELNSTALLYPALGGETERFNSLLKSIQKDLGKPATGLKGKEKG